MSEKQRQIEVYVARAFHNAQVIMATYYSFSSRKYHYICQLVVHEEIITT